MGDKKTNKVPATTEKPQGKSLQVMQEEQKKIKILSKELKTLQGDTRNPETARSTIVVYILEDNKGDFEGALTSLYNYGNHMSTLFQEIGVAKTLKDIYTHYGVQLNDRVGEDVVGVTNPNTYLFDFLTEKLPMLYSDGFIEGKLIDDLVNAESILPVMMREVKKNHSELLEKIEEFFSVRKQVSSTVEQQSVDYDAIKDEVIIEQNILFDKNMQRVTSIFERSDLGYLSSTMREIEKKLNGELLPVPSSSSVLEGDIVSSEDFDALSYLIGSIVEKNDKIFSQISEMYKDIKDANKLPQSTDIEATLSQKLTPLDEKISSVLTILGTKEEDEDTQEEEERLALSVAEKIEEMSKLGDLKTEIEMLLKADKEEGENAVSELLLDSMGRIEKKIDSCIGEDLEKDGEGFEDDMPVSDVLPKIIELKDEMASIKEEVNTIHQDVSYIKNAIHEEDEDYSTDIEASSTTSLDMAEISKIENNIKKHVDNSLKETNNRISAIEENVSKILQMLTTEIEESRSVRSKLLSKKTVASTSNDDFDDDFDDEPSPQVKQQENGGFLSSFFGGSSKKKAQKSKAPQQKKKKAPQQEDDFFDDEDDLTFEEGDFDDEV